MANTRKHNPTLSEEKLVKVTSQSTEKYGNMTLVFEQTGECKKLLHWRNSSNRKPNEQSSKGKWRIEENCILAVYSHDDWSFTNRYYVKDGEMSEPHNSCFVFKNSVYHKAEDKKTQQTH